MRYRAHFLYRPLLLSLLLSVAVGCRVAEPRIISTNRTAIPVPAYVDHRVWEFMPEKAGVATLSIVYVLDSETDGRDDVVLLCYAVVSVGRTTTHQYGFASRVDGEWFVTIPSMQPVQATCADSDQV